MCFQYDRRNNKTSIHRISEIKRLIHQVSRDIAMWMFENRPISANIPQIEYEKICDVNIREHNNGENILKKDFLIGNYFKLVKHCEWIGTDVLYFVHRTIYEYFVAETIYSSIENAMIKLDEESQEELAGKIANYLKSGILTNTIVYYLKEKLIKLYNGFSDKYGKNFYEWWEDGIIKMIENGMFYYTKENICEYKNIIDKEIFCFMNLVKILRSLWKISEKKYMLEDVDKKQLEMYIRYRLSKCRMEERNGTEIFSLEGFSLEDINLSGADIKMANLQKADLQGVNLSKTDLSGVDMRGLNLNSANFRYANLQGADLRGANLEKIDLSGANIRDTIFDEKQIYYLRNKYNLENSKVYLFKEEKITDYL